MDRAKFYFNSIGSRITGQDFLLLGALKSEPTTLNSPDEADVEVYMSPNSMKILLQQLQNAVSMYEMLYGPIQLEPNVNMFEEINQKFPGVTLKKIENK